MARVTYEDLKTPEAKAALLDDEKNGMLCWFRSEALRPCVFGNADCDGHEMTIQTRAGWIEDQQGQKTLGVMMCVDHPMAVDVGDEQAAFLVRATLPQMPIELVEKLFLDLDEMLRQLGRR